MACSFLFVSVITLELYTFCSTRFYTLANPCISICNYDIYLDFLALTCIVGVKQSSWPLSPLCILSCIISLQFWKPALSLIYIVYERLLMSQNQLWKIYPINTFGDLHNIPSRIDNLLRGDIRSISDLDNFSMWLV